MKLFIPKRTTYFWKVSLLLLFFCSTCGAFASKIKVIDGLKYMLDTKTNEATLIAYNYSGRIDVPEKVTFEGTDYSVVAFGAECFKDCPELVSVKIPNSVKELGDYCFNNATNLTEIDIPESVTHLGEGCFLWAWNLEKVTLPSSITEISKQCFGSCTNLKDIKIPDSVTKLGEACFNGTSLENISIPASITAIPDGCFMACQSLRIINIPKTVTTFGKEAFRNTGFKDFEIPSTVKSIGEECFAACDSLSNIIIPNAINIIPNGCFYGCSFLKSIYLPETIETLGSNAFHSTGIKEFEIPSTIKSIGESCFQNCKSLTNLIIPASIDSLPQYCVSGCTNLNSFYIPETVKSLGSHCFDDCNSLLVLKCLATIPPKTQEDTFSGLSFCNLYVPKISINSYKSSTNWNIFKKVNSLDEATLTGFTTIDNLKYFYDGTNSTAALLANNYSGSIAVPENIAIKGKKYTVTSFVNSCFYNCSDLTEISIPNTINVLGENCFNGCSNLTNIMIPSSVSVLGNGCFASCSSLQEITLSQKLDSLNDYCFSRCSSLSSISLPEGIKKLGKNCFYGCKKLTAITLPSTLAYIAPYCFTENTLREIRCNAYSVPHANWDETDPYDTFSTSTCILYVRKNLVKEFKNDDNWKNFKYIFAFDETPTISFQEIDGIEYLIDQVTKEASVTDLKKEDADITIPNTIEYNKEEYAVTGLSSGCFKYKNFYNINIPSTVKTIGKGCFRSCNNIKTIVLPESIKTIPNACFFFCKQLEEIEIPSSTDSIGKWAFYMCLKLEKINIPEGVKTLSDYALCLTSIRNLTLPSTVNCVYTVGLHVNNLEELTCLSIEPPFMKGDTKYLPTENSTLYVPQESLDKYKQANGWKEFYDIEPLKATGIKNNVKENLSYTVNDGLLAISGLNEKEKVDIYNVSGVLLASIYSLDGKVYYPLAKNDIIIVKRGKNSFKILR